MPHRAMMIHFRKTKDLKRQETKRSHCRIDIGSAIAHSFEKLLKLLNVHNDKVRRAPTPTP